MTVLQVLAPNEGYNEAIRSFLGKSGLLEAVLWRWQMNLAFQGELDGLESRFYLGLMEGRIVGNISLWEYNGLGILGHVYTVEGQRRKGIFRFLLAKCLEDFRNREGKVLVLGTPVDAPWNTIYKEFGFRNISEGSEVMRYDADPIFLGNYFQSQEVYCREPKWSDWPSLSILYTSHEGWRVRSIEHRIFGPFDYEDYFLQDMNKMRENECHSVILLTEKEYVVGHAHLTIDTQEGVPAWLLDFFVHPQHASKADLLLESMVFPMGRIRCFVETDNHEKMSILSHAGFHKAGVSSIQVGHERKEMDIILMERRIN